MAERTASISIQATTDLASVRAEFNRLREELAQNPFEVSLRASDAKLRQSTFGSPDGGAPYTGPMPSGGAPSTATTRMDASAIRQQMHAISVAMGANTVGANAATNLGGFTGRAPGVAPNSIFSGDLSRAINAGQTVAIVNPPSAEGTKATTTVRPQNNRINPVEGISPESPRGVAMRENAVAPVATQPKTTVQPTGKPDQSYARTSFRERLDYLDQLGGYRNPSEEVSFRRLRTREAELRMSDPSRTVAAREKAAEDYQTRLGDLDKAVRDNAQFEVWKRSKQGTGSTALPQTATDNQPIPSSLPQQSAPAGLRARAQQALTGLGMPTLGNVAGGMSLGQALPLIAGSYMLDGGIRGQNAFAAGGASAGADMFAQAQNQLQFGGGIEAQLTRQLPVISSLADYLSGATLTLARRQREVTDQQRVEQFRVGQQTQIRTLGFAGESAAASISGSFDSATTAARIGFTERENARRQRMQERNQAVADKYAGMRNDFDVQNTSGSIYDAYVAQPLYGVLGYETLADRRIANAASLQQQTRSELAGFKSSDAAEVASSERLRDEEVRAARIKLRNEIIEGQASVRQSDLAGNNEILAAQIVGLQGQRQIAVEAAGRAQSPEQQAAARQQVERVDAAIRSLQNSAIRQAQISLLQSDAGLNRTEGSITGFRRDRAVLAATQEARAALIAIDPSAPGAAEQRRQIEYRRNQQIRIAEFEDQRSEIAAQTSVRVSQYRMSGGTLESQLTNIRGQFAANTVGLDPNSPEYRRARDVAQQQEREARFNSAFSMTQLGIGLRGEALATNAMLGRNYAGAEAYSIAASGAARVRDILMGPGSNRDNEAAAELARQNSIGQLGVARQEYLLGFRAQQFNPFEMMPFNPRDRQNPEEVLGAFREAEGQIRDANVNSRGGMPNISPDSMRQFAQIVKDGISEAITSRIANN